MTWRLWPLLPMRSIPRYLEHMERDHGLRFVGLGWLPLFAKYKRIHPLHAANYDIDYFPEKDPAEIQEFFDMCEASGWEPVLQQQQYKIFREDPAGAIPLYWDEEERRAVWKKAARKHFWVYLITTLICLPLLWLIWRLYAEIGSDGLRIAALYYQPRYMQLVIILGLFSILWAFLSLFSDWITALLPWEKDPPQILWILGHLNTLLVHGGIIAIVFCVTMASIKEYRQVGSFVGALIGNGIGHLTRGYFDESAADRRKLKGIFGPPKIVAILASVTLVLYGVGILGYQFIVHNTDDSWSLNDPDEPVWVVTDNIMCETVVYDAMHHSYNHCIYDLRDNRWIQSDLERHRSDLMEALVGKDIFSYITPEGLKAGIAEGGSDLNARRAHAVAADLLAANPEIDEVLISQIGHRYIVACDDRVYRLHCDLSFYDDPTLGMEETDVPEIEARGQEIYESLMNQKEELEKMFLN
ncbi:MAG: DUF2812 domain-containing protein [Firmicutes bacterium]|nr:DUF2812 domain-containing protein [Bacillota bacterium]